MGSFEHVLCIVAEGSAASPALRQAVDLARGMEATLDVAGIDDVSAPALRDALASSSLGDGSLQTGWIGTLNQSDDRGEGLQQYVAEGDVDLVVTTFPANSCAVAPLSTDPLKPLLQHLACSLFVVAQATPLTSLQRLLVPTDFSDTAQTALEQAVALAKVGNASIDLLHVIEKTPYVALTPVDRLSLGSSSVAEHRAQSRLEELLAEEARPDVPITPHVEYGTPADQIADFIDQNGVDLTVMPTGSAPSPVSARILRRATHPVLLARAS